MSEMIINQLIKERYESLSIKEKKVAKYIIDNYQQSMLLSSTELAVVAGVSNTAVIRFAKSLGFTGFLEYKKTLKKEYVPTQKVYSSLALMERDSKGRVLDIYLNTLLSDMSEFCSGLDSDILSDMSKAIVNSNVLYLVGFGSDEVIVCFLKNYLNIMGKKCVEIREEGLALKENMFLLESKDVVFMSAYPTLTESEKWVAEYARRKNAQLLLITDSEITAKNLGIETFVAFNETADNFFNSYVLQMAYCNALLLRIYELYPEKTKNSLKDYQKTLL